MIPGQTKQFGTFDNLSDRKDLVYLFEQLGAGLPEERARDVRAKFLRMVVLLSHTSLANSVADIDPEQCDATKAYQSFVHIIGVLEVRMADAVRILEECVRKKMWLSPMWQMMCAEQVIEVAPRQPRMVLTPEGWLEDKPLPRQLVFEE